MKQTAVEWFLNEFQKQVWFEENSELDLWIKDLIPKAKAMEKEMYFQFFKAGQESMEEGGKGFEQYYNETYKSK